MKTEMIKKTRMVVAFMLLAAGFTACKKDNPVEPELTKPSIDNVEIGLGNNEMGVIGKDFHFNADVLAGTKIESVQVRILPRTGESYAKEWKHEITWTEYKDAKNANVHKHFNIPAEAAEGKYDFFVIVNDQNGTKLELKRSISIYSADNVPVNPEVFLFNVGADKRLIYDLANGGFLDPVTQKYGNGPGQINKGDNLVPSMTVTGIKGDGKMYVVLINKKHKHRPETIDAIDF